METTAKPICVTLAVKELQLQLVSVTVIFLHCLVVGVEFREVRGGRDVKMPDFVGIYQTEVS